MTLRDKVACALTISPEMVSRSIALSTSKNLLSSINCSRHVERGVGGGSEEGGWILGVRRLEKRRREGPRCTTSRKGRVLEAQSLDEGEALRARRLEEKDGSSGHETLRRGWGEGPRGTSPRGGERRNSGHSTLGKEKGGPHGTTPRGEGWGGGSSRNDTSNRGKGAVETRHLKNGRRREGGAPRGIVHLGGVGVGELGAQRLEEGKGGHRTWCLGEVGPSRYAESRKRGGRGDMGVPRNEARGRRALGAQHLGEGDPQCTAPPRTGGGASGHEASSRGRGSSRHDASRRETVVGGPREGRGGGVLGARRLEEGPPQAWRIENGGRQGTTPP
uniref:Uncharacterized protein n=1 Tax=Solanum lycopersicum TaxID=4081 RepID=K4D022_SOLLC